MTTAATIKIRNPIKTFEDLKGLRAECYVRDSTLDQKDGFGPDIQRHNEERFAQSYGLILGNRWYTEFVSGRYAKKRPEFLQFIEDAQQDRFDVLLVDHTSRFGRNQEECIKYKKELRLLGKTVIFVSQGIISGSDRDFLSERINETLDEQYSRNLSRYISAGLAEKAEHGLHVGPVPLGYKSELVSGRRERKVPDPATMPILLAALRLYATGTVSYAEVADNLNSHGFRVRSGKPFTGYSIRDIMANRFYEGKVVYHEGLADEIVVNGCHEVPQEVKDLWTLCQSIKNARRISGMGHPRGESHIYPFSRLLKCHRCASPYHGEAVYYKGIADLRLTHERRTFGRQCNVRPRSRSVESLNHEFGDRVVSNIHLADGWKSLVLDALRGDKATTDTAEQQDRLSRALENLRKQHVWGDISDDDYRRERISMERQLRAMVTTFEPPEIPNLERAAKLLTDLPSLWSHPGVTHQQRETLLREVFSEIQIDGESLVSIRPKPAYTPLFASMVVQDSLGYRDLDSPPPPPRSVSPQRRGVLSP